MEEPIVCLISARVVPALFISILMESNKNIQDLYTKTLIETSIQRVMCFALKSSIFFIRVTVHMRFMYVFVQK